MVDKVVPAKFVAARPDSVSLRSNFKNASSGLRVPSRENVEAAIVTTSTVKTSAVRTRERAGSVADHLREAISHSSRALDALKQVGEMSKSDNALGVVENLAGDLDKVRNDIHKALGTLKDRADAVEVLHENLSSADTRLDEVDAASEHAKDTGSYIRTYQAQAIEAHSNLTPESVASLLDDQ